MLSKGLSPPIFCRFSSTLCLSSGFTRVLDSRRYYVVGYGETQPIASNATSISKASNRRLEIEISPLTEG
ncbi:MAG: hypothetical protein L3J24_07645 [Xanthomonadales bacterium]|nr:hypothetical protein [Xanthomonadales bacterium]